MAVELIVGSNTTEVVEVLQSPPGPEGPPGPPGVGYLTGTGSPEGSVSAARGTHYVDTDGTNGVVEYIKTTASGNTGWKVFYGDTGWRTVDMTADWSPYGLTGGGKATFDLRRLNNKVMFRAAVYPAGDMINRSKDGRHTTLIEQLPAGFGTAYYQNAGWASIGMSPHGSIIALNGRISLNALIGLPGSYSANDVLYINAEYETTDAWPTTLPGTAA